MVFMIPLVDAAFLASNPGKMALAAIMSHADRMAGMKLNTSSTLAETRPKYRYLSFLYPTMESRVLTPLYRNPNAGPPIIM